MNSGSIKLPDGKEFEFKRKEDCFLDWLHEEIRSKGTVEESLDAVLIALESRNYVAPRIYRKKNNLCYLVRSRGLPKNFLKQGNLGFNLTNPILEQIICNRELIHDPKSFQNPSLDLGEGDPLFYIQNVYPEAQAIVGIPYEGKSQILPGREIKGALVVNYDPTGRKVDPYKIRLLELVARTIGDKVTELLVVKHYQKIQEKLESKNAELEQMASSDFLTGLYNRRKMYSDLKNNLNSQNADLYFILIDLDNFKGINDTKGHSAGDQVLVDLAKILQKYGSNSYRYGGDEMAIVLEGKSSGEIAKITEKILYEYKQLPIPLTNLSFSLSIGGVNIRSGDFSSVDELVQKTDVALYEAKRTGKGKAIIY